MFGGRGDGPLIYAIWHNRLALSMVFWNRYVRVRRPAQGLAALISASKDGAILARTLEHFRVRAVRGSSSRRGAQSLVELKRAVDKGFNVAITPDGPRGPKYTIHNGILALAQVTQRPIIPVGARISGKYTLKSWDEFQVPLPFARCDLFIGQPLVVPPAASEAEKELIRGELRRRLAELNGE